MPKLKLNLDKIKDLPTPEVAITVNPFANEWNNLVATGAVTERQFYITPTGRVLGDQNAFGELIKRQPNTIRSYVSEGLPIVSKLSSDKFLVIDIEVARKWFDARSLKGVRTQKTETFLPDALSDQERKIKADADKAVIDAQLAEVKLKEAKGRLVDADDLDKAMAEQAVLHRTDKTNDEKILPIILANKSSDEINKILHEHFQERLEMFDKLVHKTMKPPETFYDIMETVLHKLHDGDTVQDILKKLTS